MHPTIALIIARIWESNFSTQIASHNCIFPTRMLRSSQRLCLLSCYPLLLLSVRAPSTSVFYSYPDGQGSHRKAGQNGQASSNLDTGSMKSAADYYIFAISAKTKEYMSLYRQYPYLNPRYLRSVYFMTLGCLDSAHKHLVTSLTQESLCFIRCFFSLLPRRLSSYLLCKELQLSNCLPYVMRDVIYPDLLLEDASGSAAPGNSNNAVLFPPLDTTIMAQME